MISTIKNQIVEAAKTLKANEFMDVYMPKQHPKVNIMYEDIDNIMDFNQGFVHVYIVEARLRIEFMKGNIFSLNGLVL
jgi:hypothetical protein